MKTSFRTFFLLLSLLPTIPPSSRAADFFFHDGDRVVFLGDSITEQRLYTTYIEAYTLTRYPQWKLAFRNAGWGGDTSWLRKRHTTDENTLFAADAQTQQQMIDAAVADGLNRDVFPLKPTAVTIDFGMNDHGYQAFRPDIFHAYVRSETQLATTLRDHGARVALLTPQPTEEHRPDPNNDVRNQTLRKFSDGLKDVAINTGVLFVDEFDPYMTIMLRERAANTNAFIGGGDAIHPGPPGHTIMAWAILKGLHAPSLVSSATIDAAQTRVTAVVDCKVSNLQAVDGAINFDRLDRALPMPIATNAESALRLAPVLDDLSRYELQVTSLPAARYELIIDGVSAGTFLGEQLAKGCNLTGAPGPITQQTQRVLQLVVEKNNAYYNRWRNVQLLQFPDWAKSPELEDKRTAEIARLDREIADLEAEINAARTPKPHHFELKPAVK
jgi:lysophospholipase L1-like esterase